MDLALDQELIPEILPVDSRLFVSGPVSDFIDIISRALRVVPTKEVIPGTAHVLLEAKPRKSGTQSHLRASGTNGSITVSAVGQDITVTRDGSALIPGQKFLSILKMAPERDVSVNVVGNQAILRSGRAQWRVQLVPGGSLPSIPDISSLEQAQVASQPFLVALKAAILASSSSTARSSLMQVRVEDGFITAMDGNRIHRKAFGPEDDSLSLSIPLSTCLEVVKLLESSSEEHFLIGSGGKNMAFLADRDYIVSSALVTEFPEVEPILVRASMQSKYEFTVAVSELKSAVQRVRVNADPDFSAIFLSLDGESLSVRSQDSQGNSAYEQIELEARWEFDPRELCVNHKHLTDLLDSYPDEYVTFQVGEDSQSVKSPLLVESDGDFVGLLQQMRSDYLT